MSVVELPVPKSLEFAAEIKFDAQTVAFQADSAEFADPAAAQQALAGVAAHLVANPQQVTLTGTTATDGAEEGRQRLSMQRAEAVKALFVALGVRPDSIATVGAGTSDPRHVVDVDTHGDLVPELAAQNRAVFLNVG